MYLFLPDGFPLPMLCNTVVFHAYRSEISTQIREVNILFTRGFFYAYLKPSYSMVYLFSFKWGCQICIIKRWKKVLNSTTIKNVKKILYKENVKWYPVDDINELLNGHIPRKKRRDESRDPLSFKALFIMYCSTCEGTYCGILPHLLTYYVSA